MAEFRNIFFGWLLINVVVTLRATGLIQKLRGLIGGTAQTSATSSDLNPLVGGSGTSGQDLRKVHKNLLFKYLAVYLLATLSDWFQGPYVYALYAEYGFSRHDIAVLFVAGFGSSMIFGSFVGGLADSCGRRKFVILYAITYAASCATKHFKDYWILMLGRLLGGIATSLLFSVFDSWLIRAHSDKGVQSMLSTSFSAAAYGNSVIAILAGLIAERVADMNKLLPISGAKAAKAATTLSSKVYMGGYLNPFDASAIALCLCGLFALILWEENYGDQHGNNAENAAKAGREGILTSWKKATAAVFANSEILLCGIITSLFEGSMYVFVFMWTPCLTALVAKNSKDQDESKVNLPFGVIFSTFMVCCMVGSSLFSVAMEKGYKVERLAVLAFIVGTGCMLAITLAPNDTVAFLAMNIFEICVGLYFPTMGTLKSMIVPECSRAAIYNLYRIPLNFIVLMSLLTHLTVEQSFGLCTLMLFTAVFLQQRLSAKRMTVTTSVAAPSSTNELSDMEQGKFAE